MAGEETEITLGAGKLLGLFFLLAAVCGIFLAIGYSIGKTSAHEQALNDRAAEPAQTATTEAPAKAVEKPSAAVQGTADSSAAQKHKPGDSTPDLTFYKAVRENGPNATPGLSTTTTAALPREASSASTEKPTAEIPEPKQAERTAPAEAVAPATSSSGDYLVQVAAVLHEEDAAALAGALRKKSYSASVINNPASKDKLYHVVIGPFATKQDADAMKLKLTAEGYNPIVKR